MLVSFLMLVLLFSNCSRPDSNVSLAPLASEAPEFLTVKNNAGQIFYASPQGDDSKDYLQSLIQQAISAGPNSRIILSPGTYRLVCDNRPQTFCLSINNAQGLLIEGTPGQTKILVASPLSGTLLIASSSATIIAGIDFDYETPPFTQGTVTSVSPGAFRVQIDSGYRQPNHPDLIEMLSSGEASGMIFAPGTKTDKWGDAHIYAAIAKSAPVDLGGGQWQFGVYNGNITSLLAPGDRIALSGRPTHSIISQWNDNIQFSQVRMFASPAMAFVFVQTKGNILMDQITIVPTPGSDRLLSTNGDAVHVKDSSARVILQSSYFANMGDDALNIGAVGRRILLATGNYFVIEKGSLPYEVGNVVQISSPIHTGAVPQPRFTDGEAVITGIQEQANTVTVYLSKNIPASVQVGDLVFNIHHASPGSLIQNNTFGSYHGSLRLRSVGAQMLNNRFMDARFAKILFSADAPWNEGPMVNVPHYSGNTADGGVVNYYGLNFTLSATESPVVSGNSLTPIYRLYNPAISDHNFSHSSSEGVAQGAQLEGLVFFLKARAESGLRPLYRCSTLVGGFHFLSILANCEGQTTEGVLGYLAADANTGGRPLYRAVNTLNGHHLQTTNTAELVAPMRSEGILGYVW
ncbi:hypothetical protein D3C87_301290 [compost metagenome]